MCRIVQGQSQGVGAIMQLVYICYSARMRTKLLTVIFLASLSTLALVNGTATTFFLYWRYTWLDMPVHVLGGVTVALGVFLLPCVWPRVREKYLRFWPVLMSVLVVGILWEVFEYKIGIPFLELNYTTDTVGDLIMDILGGVIGYGMGRALDTL